MSNKDISRRDFLKTTGIATGTLIGGGLIGELIGFNSKKTTASTKSTETKTNKTSETSEGKMFFTTDK